MMVWRACLSRLVLRLESALNNPSCGQFAEPPFVRDIRESGATDALYALLQTDRAEIQLDELNAALSLTPRDPAILTALGLLMCATSRFRAAIDYVLAIPAEGRNPVADMCLARGAMAEGDVGLARKTLDQLRPASGASRAFQLLEAACQSLEGRTFDALMAVADLVDATPGSSEGWQLLVSLCGRYAAQDRAGAAELLESYGFAFLPKATAANPPTIPLVPFSAYRCAPAPATLQANVFFDFGTAGTVQGQSGISIPSASVAQIGAKLYEPVEILDLALEASLENTVGIMPGMPLLSAFQRLSADERASLTRKHSALKLSILKTMSAPFIPNAPVNAAVRCRIDDARQAVQDLWSGDGTSDACGIRWLKTAEAMPSLHAARQSCADWFTSFARYEDAAGILLNGADPTDCQLRNVPEALLLATVLVKTGRTDAATEVLDRACREFGHAPDLILALGNCSTDVQGRIAALNRLWARNGLSGVRLLGCSLPMQAIRPAAPAKKVAGPKVSVIMPVKNVRKTMSYALYSLLLQSWENLEILVLDDGSTDGTQRLVRLWQRIDHRIRSISAGGTGGAYIARNKGAKEATGEFLTVMDGDDWSHPQKIELQVRELLDQPERTASMSAWVRCSNALTFERWRNLNGWIYPNYSSLMVRRQLLDLIGDWDNVRVGADSEFVERIKARFGPNSIALVQSAVPLSLGLQSDGSLTGQSETHLRTLTAVGIRKNYFHASARWRRRTGPEALVLRSTDPHRAFPVSAGMAVDGRRAADFPDDTIRASGLFDEMWYRRDAVAARDHRTDAAHHYWVHGSTSRFDPSPLFSNSGYRMAYLDAPVNPLHHYLTVGRTLRYSPLPSFAGQLRGKSGKRIVLFGHVAGEQVFGSERSFLDMLERFAADDAHVEVVLPEIGSRHYLSALRDLCAVVHIIPYRQFRLDRGEDARCIANIRAVLENARAEECHVNTCTLSAPVVAAKAAGIATVMHIREYLGDDDETCLALGGEPEQIRTWLIGNVDRLVANSQIVADWLAMPERTTVKANGVQRRFADIPFAPGPRLRFGLIGSGGVRKGIDHFVQLARRLAKNPDVCFTLVGPVAPRTIPDGMANIRSLGYVDDPLIAIENCDVVMSLSSFGESFGRTVLEGMAAGRPILCFDRGHPAQLVRAANCGIVVPIGDIDALVQAALRLSQDRNLCNRYSEAGRKESVRYFIDGHGHKMSRAWAETALGIK
jgi:glycosyltransferase involved in cell wall biosynthesis